MLSYIVSILFRITYLIILIVVLLSWIPVFDTRKQPLLTLERIYNIIMAPFKAIIPPIGMIDISPIIAFIVLQILEQLIVGTLIRFGL